MWEQHTFWKGTKGYPDYAVMFHLHLSQGSWLEQFSKCFSKMSWKNLHIRADKQAEVSETKTAQIKWYLRVKTDTGTASGKARLRKEIQPHPSGALLAPELQEHKLFYVLLCELAHPRLLLDTARLQNSEMMMIPGHSCSSSPDFQTGDSTSSVSIYLGGVTPKAEVWGAAIVSWITDKQDYKAD